MASRLNPYLNFDGNARQAMEFYAAVFGGEPAFMTFGQLGIQGADADRIMHAALETDAGYLIMGSDITSDMDFQPAVGMTVSISGDDADALRGYWAQLSAGGSVRMPLEKQAWGDEFGMCVDQFGVPWMVDIGAQQA
jgi:PhnB protein